MKLFLSSMTVTLLTLSAAGAGPTTAPSPVPEIKWGPLLNKNGGFEDGKSLYHMTRPIAAQIDAEVVYRGQHSLRLQGEGVESGDNNICVQGLAVSSLTPTTRFLLRVAVKAQNVNPEFPPSAQLIGGIGKDSTQYFFPENTALVIRNDCDWKVMEVVVSELPKDLTKLGFWLQLPKQSKATVWFDDVEVRRSDK